MKRFLVILILFLTLPALAGVVEDAEAELKKLKDQQKLQQASQAGPGASPNSSQGSEGYPINVSEQPGQRSRTSRSRARQSPQGTTRSSDPGVVELDESKKESRERSRVRSRKRDKSDRLLSVLGLAVLALLIALGTWFGSRGDHSD